MELIVNKKIYYKSTLDQLVHWAFYNFDTMNVELWWKKKNENDIYL